MKLLILSMFIIAGFSSCSLINQNGSFTNSSIQKVDMGKFNGLKIIEIAALNYPETTTQTATSQLFTDKDKDNFGDTLIQSLKRSDVRVLPSAQTKIHINFTQLVMADGKNGKNGKNGKIMTMTAEVAVSRNGIISRKTIKISSKSKPTIGATKDNGVELFIQELGNLLREQSSFKR
jgi:hypothetical protein